MSDPLNPPRRPRPGHAGARLVATHEYLEQVQLELAHLSSVVDQPNVRRAHYLVKLARDLLGEVKAPTTKTVDHTNLKE